MTALPYSTNVKSLALRFGLSKRTLYHWIKNNTHTELIRLAVKGIRAESRAKCPNCGEKIIPEQKYCSEKCEGEKK